LSLRDRLLMLLAYYRLYVSMTLVEFLFEIDQTNVSRNIRILEPLVRQCVPLPEKVHERASTPEEVGEIVTFGLV
jgi:hypothetical protein